jgi:hypothetical protein
MGSKDNLFGIKTEYKGIKMRSKFEAKFAYFLDKLNIKWVYEPKTFLLASGDFYKPDFYLTELNIWIETKGVIEEHNKQISYDFANENKTTIILWAPNELIHYEFVKFEGKIGEVWVDDIGIQFGFCSKCKRRFITSMLGDYKCTACLNHNGDHDITNLIQKGELGFQFWNIEHVNDFVKSIKGGLE